MKRYKMKIPRRALGVAAVAMTVLTLGLAIVLPALTGTRGHGHAMARSVSTRTQVEIRPSHIEIAAVDDKVVFSTRAPSPIDFLALVSGS